MSSLIEISDLNFSYAGEPALCGIHLSVEAGTTLGLIGPNGGGKTTLLKLLLGLLKPQSGIIRIAGLTPRQAVARGDLIGYLPQKADARAAAVRALETDSRAQARTQLFIETPYRNEAMLETLATALAPATRVCVACDLTLPGESIVTLPARDWRARPRTAYARRPAIFLLHA